MSLLPFSIGVELEFNTANLYNLSEATYRGIQFGAGFPGWLLKTDGSAGSTAATNGYEAVSPVLREDTDLLKIRYMCNHLLSKGAQLNERCGLHVHVGGLTNLPYPNSKELLNKLFFFLVRYEEAFFSLADGSRQANRYCKRLSPEIVDRLRDGDGFSAWRNFDDRYTWLNGFSARNHDTLEFRLQGGSLDWNHIFGWISLILCVCDTKINEAVEKYSNNFKPVPKGGAKLRKSVTESRPVNVHNMAMRAGLYGKSVRNKDRAVTAREWVQNRYLELHGKTYREEIYEASKSRARDGVMYAPFE